MAMMRVKSRINLRTFTAEDLEKVKAWSDDEELAKFLGLKLPGEEVDYYKRCQKLLGKRNSRVLAIEDRGGRFIGEVELNQIAWRRKEAELHICIGERRYWGQGLGTEAVLAALDLAFEDMGLKSVYLRVYRHNLRAIRCYEKCGFRKEAILRNRFRSECGKGYDVFLMKIKAREHFSQTTA